MRVTIHNGRAGKNNNGAYKPEHLDRDFPISHAEHINPEQEKNNWYWNCFNNPNMTFKDVEAEFYKIHCTKHLRAQNARYEEQRHPERVKTMDEYRQNPRTCPEETILMVGCKGDSIPPNTLRSICEEFRDWEEKTFPGLYVVDMALHGDEQGAVHIHERKIWLYTDKQGYEAVGQNRALEQAGIQLPYPEKPRSRYNNRKQTYSKQARQKFIDICKDRGLGSLLETQPREKSKAGLTQIEYQIQKSKERASIEESRISSRLEDKRKACTRLQNRLEELKNEVASVQDLLHKAEQRQAFEIFNREHERTR